MNDLSILISHAVDKKELRGISEEFILKVVEEFKKLNPSVFLKLQKNEFNPKSKEFVVFKKFVRKRLRELHGVFQKNKLSDKKKEAFLLNEDFDFDFIGVQKFLKSHRSTNERLAFYESLYNKLQEKSSIVSLVDLGCGLNPLSYSLLKNLKNCFCADINEEEVNFLNDFFKKCSFKGEMRVLDLTSDSALKMIFEKTKNTDCCFLLKVLDGLESVKRGSSKTLLENINSGRVVISFSKKTISGKNSIVSERFWFKNLLVYFESKGYKSECFNLGFEEYFVLEKPK